MSEAGARRTSKGITMLGKYEIRMPAEVYSKSVKAGLAPHKSRWCSERHKIVSLEGKDEADGVAATARRLAGNPGDVSFVRGGD